MCSPACTSMPVSSQVESPVICSSCERRGLPEGMAGAAADGSCAEARGFASCADCANSSRGNWTPKSEGGSSLSARVHRGKAIFLSGREYIQPSHPAAGVYASSQLTDAAESCKSWMKCEPAADSLTDEIRACKLTRCRRVATEE